MIALLDRLIQRCILAFARWCAKGRDYIPFEELDEIGASFWGADADLS